jgi:sugar-specific transcriptional regulator TrmB
MTSIELLKLFGLTNYEAEVYAALLKVERVKANDLAKMVSVPRPMIYLTLKKLVNKEMCIENKGKVNHYSASSPSIVLQNMLQNEKEMFKIKERGLQELNKVYNKREKTDIPFEFIQVLKGKQYTEFAKRAVSQSEKEILVFDKYPLQQNEKDRKGVAELEIKTLKRGIKIRCLYEASGLNDSKFLPYYKKVLNHGEIGRIINFLPMNIMIVDETVAMFPLSHKDEKDITVFIFNHPALISAMKGTFEYFWSKGTDINKALTKDKV